MPPAPQHRAILESATDAILLLSLTVIAVISTGAWLTGQLAALFSHGKWLPASVGQSLTAAWRLPGDARDPRRAWPASMRPDLPGPIGFLIAGMVASLVIVAIMLGLGWWALGHRPQRGFASRAQIRDTLSERAVIRRAPVVRPSLLKRRLPR